MDHAAAASRPDLDVEVLMRVADLVPVPLWVSGGLSGDNWANRAMSEFTGRPPGEYDGDGWSDGIHPDDVDGYVAVCERTWAAREPYEVVYRLRGADGSWRWVLNRAVPLVDRDAGYIGASIDITDQVRLVEEVDAERRRLALLVDVLSDLVGAATEQMHEALRLVIARIGEFTDVDRVGLVRIDRVRRTMELDWAWHSARITEDFEVQTSISLDAHPEVARRLEAQEIVCIGDVEAMPDSEAVDREMLLGRGIRANAVVPIVLGGTVTGLLFLDDHHARRDWSGLLPSLQVLGHALAAALGRYEHDAQLRHQAFHDALTGLPNRSAVDRQIGSTMCGPDSAWGCRPDAAVVLLDLDGFKTFNDSLGHTAGDRLLVEVARRLRDEVGDAHTVARLGGDEFAVIVNGGDAPATARDVAARIERALAQPIDLDGREVVVSASIGISHTADDLPAADVDAAPRLAPEVLLRNADLAMFAAKDAGRGRIVEFDATLERRAHERLALQTDLRRALIQGELVVHYQPTIDIDSGDISSVEALVRWQHPTRGLLGPGLFLPMIEQHPLIEQVGEWVLDAACRQAREWSDAYGWTPAVAVNVAPRQLANPGFVDSVVDLLRRHGLPAERLVLEITERSLLDDASSRDRLAALRRVGIRLAVDDFGTGYSSLSYLRHLPVDILKIDRSFVVALDDGDERSTAMVSMIIELAAVLGLRCVAEGIEEEAHLTTLRLLGCHYGQGYLIAKPQPAAQVAGAIVEQLRRSSPVAG